MNKFLKKFFSITMLLSCVAAFAANDTNSGIRTTVSRYPNRSQSTYKFHQTVGISDCLNNLNDVETWHGKFSATAFFNQTFRSRDIARSLFGNDFTTITSATTGLTALTSCDSKCSSHVIKVQGSTVANRDANAWLADYMYLPTDFDGSFSVSPKIQTFGADLSFYLGLDEWWGGAYVNFSGPIAHTRFDLNFKEQTATSAGTVAGSYAEGYFTPLALPSSSLLTSARSYFDGQTPGTNGVITQTDAATIVRNVTFEPLNFARMGCGARKETGFADLRMELGWNFWKHDDYHVGINIQAAAPTGNKGNSRYMFDATVGNGKHWELGGGLKGHYVFFRSEDDDQQLSFFGDLNVTHLFKRSEMRTFDLKDKPNSKYMLAVKHGANTQNLSTQTAPITVATSQFAEVYTPVANLTTMSVDTSVKAQVNLIAQLNYTYKQFSFDLGYNFYFRSCEKIDCNTGCEPCGDSITNLSSDDQANTWALKGDARAYGYASATAGGLADNQAIPLSISNSNATIHGGSNINATVTSFTTHVNAAVDNSRVASAGTTNQALTQTAAGTTAISTSIQPLFLSDSSVDKNGAKVMSHTLFGHAQYNFMCNEDWTPSIGIGANVEFGQRSGSNDCGDSTTTTDCSTRKCSNATPSRWGVWLKGAIAFN